MPEAALELPPGCQLRLAQAGDVPALHALHEAVLAALPDPSLFRLFGGAESFFQTHCGQRGESWVVAQGGQLLGYAALTLPMADDADNYALNLGWPAERARRVGLLSAAMVRPSQRQQGLHRALIRQRLLRAQALGLPELLARAAPANALSRQGLMSQGLAIVWLGEQAGGLQRHVYWRRSAAPVAGRVAIWLAADDTAGQQAALAQGWLGLRSGAGRIGYGPPEVCSPDS
ncbi:MAG: hypothetical protein U1E77_12905 [Inhella sp.]